MFNIGAFSSELASIQALDTDEGLKTATKLYQQAAGCFSYIRENSLTSTRNDCTSDLYPETLSALVQIMLAQAQEVFYLKAVKDKMRDLIMSKLAAQCSDNYAEAMKSVQLDSLKELQKVWLPILAGKQALYHALSEYHKAEHESNEKNIGECIARLGKAAELIKTAEQRGGKEMAVKSHLNTIQVAHEKAKRENEYVYHERVPDYLSLKPLEKAALAKVIAVKFPISDEFRDLFATLVPMNVHNGLQLFKTKKMEAFNLEIGKLRQATELLNAALTTWNLPAAIEDVGAKSQIPQSLIDKSQMIKDKGGIARIDSMAAELPPLLQRNTEILNETKRLLQEEERSDSELRSQMKEKWTRTASAQLTEYLHSEIRQYEGIIQSAIKANKVIEEKYAKNRDGIQLLSKSAHEISSSLPAATPVAALQNTHIIKDLRRLMDEVEALRNVREVLESEMKCIDSDALTAKLISALSGSQGLDEHSIIQTELDELVGPMRKQVRENIQEQEKLLGYIEKANGEFSREKVHNETSKMREQMLRNLASASDSYNELYNHLVEGVKFYNDLTPILIKFQSKVNDFVFARKTEKDDLMKEIQTSLSRPSTASKPTRPPPPGVQSPPNPSGTASPYPTNNFASPYYPMMPNSYNPYTAYPPPMAGQPPQPPTYNQSGYSGYPPNYP
ncbi:programmed cell death 6-interacting [Brachionus plicatilis]|uniref:Programmed cell death 6-interacting n=1 Tax=Brachionus plicatilis TaxID=10195 RepID=A0A3M7QLD7_BRAPC|nr:programmed cell death 6-interacting [Brachionus plicatilis]